MRKITFSFKSLLLAAGLLMGSTNVWAEDWATVWSADFSSAPSGMTYSVSGGSTSITNGYLEYHQGGGTGNRALSTAFTASAFAVDTNWKMEFDWNASSSNQNASNVTFATSEASAFTITWAAWSSTATITDANAAELTTALPILGYNKSTCNSWSHITITGDTDNGIYLTVTNGATTYVNNVKVSSTFGYPATFNGSLGRAVSHMFIDNIDFSTPKVSGFVAPPTSTITGAADTSRKFTLACLTENTTIYYATSDLEKGAAGWTEYTGEVTTAATTIWAYAKDNEDNTSDKMNFETGAGTVIDLANPTMQTTAMTPNGSYYTPTFSFANGDNSSLIGSPSATLSATFNGNAILGFDGTFTPNMDGILVVTSSADGYGSSDITVNCFVLYDLDWQSVDYSTLTEEDLATSFPTWEKTESGRWSSWKDIGGNYTYYTVTDGNSGYAEFTFDTNLRIRRGIASLVPTYGIGRNTNETLKVINASDNDIVSLKIYNGHGNYSVADAHWFSYNFRNGSDVTFTLNNGALLVQASIYTPVASVPVTVTAASYATYVPSYDLDFSTTEIKAYKVKITGKETATLSRVDKVPAGAPVLLYKEGGATENIPVTTGAAAIPSSENNLVAGTGAAVPSDEEMST